MRTRREIRLYKQALARRYGIKVKASRRLYIPKAVLENVRPEALPEYAKAVAELVGEPKCHECDESNVHIIRSRDGMQLSCDGCRAATPFVNGKVKAREMWCAGIRMRKP